MTRKCRYDVEFISEDRAKAMIGSANALKFFLGLHYRVVSPSRPSSYFELAQDHFYSMGLSA